MKFFLEKQLIKFSCTYWPYSLCKIKKKNFRATPSYDDIPFSGQKCLNKLFLVQPIIITFTYLLAFSPTFSLSKTYKKSYSRSRFMRLRHFWAQNRSFAPNKHFFEKN